MSENTNTQPNGPKQPNSAPDTSHEEPNPYPVEDPMPGNDTEADPIREPEPIPTFPEPIPGAPPDVLI